MTGPGRPRTGTPILVRIPDDVLAIIDERAKSYEVTRAELVRRVLADWTGRDWRS